MKTSLRALLNIVVRLGAVLLAVHTAEQLPQVLYDYTHNPGLPAGSLTFGFIGLVVAAALWLWPQLLVWWAIGKRGGEVFETPLDAGTVQYIAFSVTGAWLAVSGLAGAIGHLVSIGVMSDFVEPLQTKYQWILVMRYGIATVAGVSLMLGAHGLSVLLQDFRGRNLPPPATDDEPG